MLKKSKLKAILLGTVLSAVTLFSTVASAANPWEKYQTSKTDAGDMKLEFTDVTIYLPASWSGKVSMSTKDGQNMSVLHKASRDKMSEQLGFPAGGFLFGIYCDFDGSGCADPNAVLLGRGSFGTYYFTTPSDVQAYIDDPQIEQEYHDLYKNVEKIRENIKIRETEGSQQQPQDSSSSTTNANDYFPYSSEKVLTDADFAGKDFDYIQMGINEICARHGRIFVRPDVKAVFEKRSWYKGTVEPGSFDQNMDSILNDVEKKNIALMQAAESKLPAGKLGGTYDENNPYKE